MKYDVTSTVYLTSFTVDENSYNKQTVTNAIFFDINS
jgi:hypothetical protein